MAQMPNIFIDSFHGSGIWISLRGIYFFVRILYVKKVQMKHSVLTDMWGKL